MALSELALPKIEFIRAARYTEGRTEPVRAFVNHRMVGYLAGTDAYFKDPDRGVSTHFGIGFIDGKLEIHQYVPLDDTAFGNGNYDPSGSWDNWGFKTTEVNPQTISIEHQDHGDPAGKGVVSPKIQLASQKLQALLRYGTIAEWKAAGIVIRDWERNAPILWRELQAITVDYKHILTHNDIAGVLKPYCWKPWQADKVGFPKAEYITAIKHWGMVLQRDLPAPTPTPVSYTQAQLDAAVKAATDPLKAQVANLTTKLTTAETALKQAEQARTDALAHVARLEDIIESVRGLVS